MTNLRRAERVLADAGVPLHVTDLAAQLHGTGWAEARASTLDAILSARINVNIRVRRSRSPFVRVGPAVFCHRDTWLGVVREREGAGVHALPFAPSAARAVVRASQKATAMEREWIEAEDLLVGVASVEEGPAVSVMAGMGIDRQELVARLRSTQGQIVPDDG